MRKRTSVTAAFRARHSRDIARKDGKEDNNDQ